MDNLISEQRKKNMRAIKNSDTKPEILLRKELWRQGYRYRKNCKNIFGKPDIVFLKKKIAVFCDGEFWHGYNYTEGSDAADTNKEYWNKKIKRNIERDKEVNEYLRQEGWIVLRFWSKEILKDLSKCVKIIIDNLEKSNF